MKPIEPGCLAIVTGGPFKVVIGTVVTVIRHVPAGTFSIQGDPIREGWSIQSQLVDSILTYNGAKTMVASEKILQRIDDGDFNPAADGEENPYVKQVSHVWKPTRQL